MGHGCVHMIITTRSSDLESTQYAHEIVESYSSVALDPSSC